MIAQAVADEVIFDVSAKQFRRYEGGIWVEDDTQKQRDWLPSLAREAYNWGAAHAAAHLKAVSEKYGPKSNEEKSAKELLATISKAYQALNTCRVIDNVLRLLCRKVGVKAERFNARPDILVLANGVYDFTAQQFKQHSPDYFATVRTEIFYSPTAKECPTWQGYLKKAFLKDAALIEYIQKLFGYSLTGYKWEQSLWFCYGDGGTGKSIFFQVQQMLAGKMTVKIPVETLLLSKRPGQSYDIARLFGARICQAAEIPKGRALNEALVKDLTGSEDLTARDIFKAPFQFAPTHKLFISGNHKPEISGTDSGIWRRVKLIPFLYSFRTDPERKEENDLMAALKEELPAILNWALEGWEKIQESGFTAPDIVTGAVASYRGEQDQIANWLAERMQEGSGYYITLKAAFADYREWCSEYGDYQKAGSSRAFASELRQKGFVVEPGSGNVMTIRGIQK